MEHHVPATLKAQTHVHVAFNITEWVHKRSSRKTKNNPVKSCMRKISCSLVALTCLALIPGLSRAQQIYVNETFDYADDAALQAKWSNPTGLTLDLGAGNSAPSAIHSGAATVHNWTGSTFSITPTDAMPLILSGDVWYSGVGNQRNTIGLRTGANPLFEMGFYNSGAVGLGVRLLGIGGIGGTWLELASYTALGATPQWIHLETTFTSKSATVKWDLGADGSYDGTQTWTGTVDVLPFSDLRFGGPSGVSSGGGAFSVDNIKLETVVPEPTIATLLGLGVTALIGFRRTRK